MIQGKPFVYFQKNTLYYITTCNVYISSETVK